MESKKAYIRWTGRLLGNGQIDLQIGLPYYPHIVAKNDPSQTEWSVRLVVTPVNSAHEGIIHFTMLVDNKECRSFWESLSSGDEFFLMEGTDQVACGYII